MSAALDDYRELRERERERERDRDRMPVGMRDDRYLPRSNRDRDARYSRYYRDDIPPSHRYSPSSSMFPPRDYPKSASLRNDLNSDRAKDGKDDMRMSTSSSSNNNNSSNSNNNNNGGHDSYTPSSSSSFRYGNNDWHRDRRYRGDDEYRWRGDLDMRRESWVWDVTIF
ncbi:hypothetical protein RO3G_09692 [Lichtheimia corymbifera JMRC:FSU:9682]|uniref:Uncharacterized protein n=1 Tax=Lichtheimia corymbifera JMRC:FSU:9682 TaxID=1263082 RepID=A0A068RNP0_9FUNG|nr:hypothetical protein RO3G_09692 [Lichtheimia corymbifera JMRC:FSU:9682]